MITILLVTRQINLKITRTSVIVLIEIDCHPTFLF